jgi:hypothetical protein
VVRQKRGGGHWTQRFLLLFARACVKLKNILPACTCKANEKTDLFFNPFFCRQ